MRKSDLIRISGRQVFRQYRKNIGVAMIIILGTAGLIMVITMGRSIEQNISSDLEIIGNATRIRVIFKPPETIGAIQDNREFSDRVIKEITRITGIEAVAGIIRKRGYVRATSGEREKQFECLGVDHSFWHIHGSTSLHGTLITAADVRNSKLVCTIGQRVAQELFGSVDVVGKFIRIENNLIEVTGVLDTISMPDKVRHIFLPITTARKRLSRMSPRNRLYIRCSSWDDVLPALRQIPDVLEKFQPGDEVELFFPVEILKRVKAIAFGVKTFVKLALISTLFLGGFGIWNIMMMSVRARTREIGLKKAIGAEDKDILVQFLAEAVLLSLSASTLGILLGWAGVSLTADIINSSPPQELFWFSVLIGFLFSLFLGVAAGIVPAIKASRMEVVTALRYE
ncbi:MAG: FtsX-like permease family protein [Desulfobulbaceae bacterium]|nr:MAG: FtsX-like permease family protein [Desulfobulbaceae bacterium]